MARVSCSHCGADLPLEAPLRYFYNDRRMCNSKCMHDAGWRGDCRPGCGCTGYALKRRMLREHRELMRCMETIVAENGLLDELDDLWQNNREPGSRAICLDYSSELDEESDEDDPEQQLCAKLSKAHGELAAAHGELADRSAMIEAVQGALQCRHKSGKRPRSR